MNFNCFGVALRNWWMSPCTHTILHCYGVTPPAYLDSSNLKPSREKEAWEMQEVLRLWRFHIHFHMQMIGLGNMHSLQWYLTCLPPLTHRSSLSLWLSNANHIKYHTINVTWVQEIHMCFSRMCFHHRNNFSKTGLSDPPIPKAISTQDTFKLNTNPQIYFQNLD